jgi:orotate phosphoribosyltransferase
VTGLNRPVVCVVIPTLNESGTIGTIIESLEELGDLYHIRIIVVDGTITTGATKVESIEKLKLLGDHEVVGFIIAVDRQERLGDADNVEDRGAVEYLEEELGLKVFSLENIETIYELIKDSLDEKMRRLWVEYYDKYGTVKLD